MVELRVSSEGRTIVEGSNVEVEETEEDRVRDWEGAGAGRVRTYFEEGG